MSGPTDRRGFLRGLAALPLAGVAAGTASGPASDLAIACLRVAERAQWLDNSENTVGMTDADWDEEFRRQDEVWGRALGETSASIHDLAAKAEMLRQDFERFHPAETHNTSDYNLLRVVLREIVQMGRLAEAEA